MERHEASAMLEICADSLAGVAAAITGRADRIELCSALDVGGLTPSAGLVAMARAACSAAKVALFAMVRPRPGDFAYDADDLALAVAEANALIAAGVDGLVFGAARDGQVDDGAARRWIDTVRAAAGRHVPCTFHRAIDLMTDPVASVSTVAGLGFDAILTSGGAKTAPAGAPTIRAMVDRAKGTPLTIMAGSGVNPATAPALIAGTGVRALHASASVAGPAPSGRLIELGFASAAPRHADGRIVAQLRSILDKS